MIKFKVLRESDFFFPLLFIILHIISFGIYFFWSGQQLLDPYYNVGKGHLIWFSDMYWPNWATLWVIYELAYKQRKYKFTICYLVAILSELFLIAVDTTVGSLEAVGMSAIDYKLIFTKLYFVNSETRTAIHSSLFLAVAQILWTLLRKNEVK